jgi:hypothetical protein
VLRLICEYRMLGQTNERLTIMFTRPWTSTRNRLRTLSEKQTAKLSLWCFSPRPRNINGSRGLSKHDNLLPPKEMFVGAAGIELTTTPSATSLS